MKISFIKTRHYTLLNALAALVIFISLNIIFSKIFINNKIDFTEDNLYTLSSNTKNIVSGLNEQIKIQLFFSESLSKDIPQIRDYVKRVRELMLAYTEVSKNVKLEVFDPKPFTDLEDLAASYGIQGLQLNQEGERFYFGAVLSNSVDDMIVIPFFEITRERFLEYDLTKSIYKLANSEKPTIGLISGLPLLGNNKVTQFPEQNSFYIYDNITEFYEVINLTNSFESIPKNLDQLIVVHPNKLSDKQLYEVDQFVLKGKGTIFFVDPFSEFERVNQPFTENDPSSLKLDINKLFTSWGFEIEPDMVVGDIVNGRKVSLGTVNKEKILTYVVWLALEGNQLSKNDIITSNLDYVFFKSAGVINNLKTNNSLVFTPLIETSINTMLIERSKIQFRADPEALLKDFKSLNKSFTLGARIKGKFKSVFSSEDALNFEVNPEDHVSESINSNVIIFTDTDLLADDTWVSKQEIFGRTNVIPTSDNGRLVMNAIESMSGGENLIDLRGRGVTNRPFIVVENLQKQAELLLKEKEESLTTQLEETEKKLQALKDESTSNIDDLSLEQNEAINEFNKQILRIRKDLRTVQRELGESIKNLETNLKLLNIWLMPTLVIFLFFTFRYFSKKRSKVFNQ